MLKRKSFLFALCAMAAATGVMGCSDDSGSSSGEIKLHPSTIGDLYPGGSALIQAEYDAQVSAKSGDDTCVKAVAGELIGSVTAVTLTAGDDSLCVNAKNAGDVCCSTKITFSSGGTSVEVPVRVVADAVAEPGIPFIKVTSGNPVSMQANSSTTVSGTYTKDGENIANAALTVKNENPDCVTVDAQAMVNAGKFDINVTAGTITGTSCQSKITISNPSEESVKPAVVTINVTGGVVTGDNTLEFYNESGASGKTLTLAFNDDLSKKEVSVRYLNSVGSPIEAGSVSYAVSGDDDCVKINKGASTDKDGIAVNTVRAISNADRKEACHASVAISAAGVKENLTIDVTVQPISEYKLSVVANLDSYKSSSVGVVNFSYLSDSDETCDDLVKKIETLTSIAENGDSYSITAINPEGDPLASVEFSDKIPVGHTTVVAVARASDESDVIAYGCYDIEYMEGAVELDMVALPTQLTGEYSLVSNFDLTSGFLKSDSKELPAAEKMLVGDWIQFIVDFCNDPVRSLYDFLWVNTVSRLDQVANTGNGTVDSIIKTVVGIVNNPATKELAYAYIKPMIDEYLTSKEAGKRSWYEALTLVSPDVADLTTNMQLTGTIDISEVSVDGDTQTVKTGEEKFEKLQYQWSYYPLSQSKPSGCDATAYGKTGKCRRTMSLGSNSITGTWSSASLTEGADSFLTIGNHKLDFKWANILFAAVFGEILPQALDYSVSEKTNIDEELYLRAFLNAIVFDPIADSYVKKLEGGTEDKEKGCVNVTVEKEDGSTEKKCWPTLSGATDPCLRFVEAIVYMIGGESVLGWKSMVPTAATFACDGIGSFGGVNELDELVQTQLSKLQTSGMDLSAKDCPVYDYLDDAATSKFQRMGLPDATAYTANEIFQAGSKYKSTRCVYDLKTSGESQTPFKGLFHATRVK